VQRRWRRALSAGCVAAALVLCSCHHATTVGGVKPRTVSLAEFSHDPTEAAAAVSTTRGAAATEPTTTAASAPAPNEIPPVEPISEAARFRPLRPGDEVVVESVIGQVSGRPIFVDEFLDPVADQLRQEGERLPQTEFIEQARRIIHDRLMDVVLNELFLAEAEAALTPQQKMGLLAFLKDFQEKTIAERGGTTFGAQQKIAQEEEMTLEEFQEVQKSEVLIKNLLYERIQPRVIVSWRDIEREYERRRGEFNPPAQVTIQRLRLDSQTQKDLIEQVKGELAAGKNFTSVIEQLDLSGSVAPLGQGALAMGPGGLAEIPDISADYKPALAKISPEPGQTTEAIELSGRTVWLHIEKVEQPGAKSIYDVQEQLVGQLRARREFEERQKYINSLFEKGIYEEIDVMLRNALAVAVLRYSRE
jgi:hypothetical protein